MTHPSPYPNGATSIFDTSVNVFAEFENAAWPFEYKVRLRISAIAGGVPSDPNVAEGWLRAKVGYKPEEEIRQLAAEAIRERGIDMDTAVAEINMLKHLNGFKRDPDEGMYIEGRQIKAAFKEAISVAVASPETKLQLRGWGNTKKFLTNYAPEHVFIEELRVPLLHAGTNDPFHEPSRILQSFPKNARTSQTGIQYTEVCENVDIEFTIKADHPFTKEEWAMIWLTGTRQGIGAQRSQGFGVYTPVKWEQTRGREVTKSVMGRPAATTAVAEAGE